MQLEIDTCCQKMATRTGLEPVTSAVTGRHSNQLNYRATCNKPSIPTAWKGQRLVGEEGIEPPTFAL